MSVIETRESFQASAGEALPPVTSRVRSRSRSIALLSPYDGGNLGDGAIQEALIQNLRKIDPQIQLCGITLNPARTAELHRIPCYPLAIHSLPHYQPSEPRSTTREADISRPVAGFLARLIVRCKRILRSVPPFRWLKLSVRESLHIVRSYRLLRGVNVLAIAGGGQLDEEWGGSWGHPYTLFKWTVLGRLAGSSIAFLSIGVCRIDSRLTRFFLKSALAFARYRSYRDSESRRLALSLTAKAEGLVVPDLAFSTPVDSQTHSRQNRLRIGVSPIAFAHSSLWPTHDLAQHERYISELVSFVSSLLQSGISVTLFTTSPPDDQLIPALIEGVHSRTDPAQRDWLSASLPESIPDLLALLQSFDFVVCSRLHGVLLSVLVGDPCLAITYDRKVTCLMEDLGQSAYCREIGLTTGEELLAALEDLRANRQSVLSRIAAIRKEYDQLLQQQFRRLAEMFS